MKRSPGFILTDFALWYGSTPTETLVIPYDWRRFDKGPQIYDMLLIMTHIVITFLDYRTSLRQVDLRHTPGEHGAGLISVPSMLAKEQRSTLPQGTGRRTCSWTLKEIQRPNSHRYHTECEVASIMQIFSSMVMRIHHPLWSLHCEKWMRFLNLRVWIPNTPILMPW